MMLYELLVGELPFDPGQLRKSSREEMRHRIREQEPAAAERAAVHARRHSGESARRRQVDLPTLRRQLRSDLDWIIMKALEKDRAGATALLSDWRPTSIAILRTCRSRPVPHRRRTG